MDRLKRRNDLECLEILRELHDYELSRDEPCEELMANCKRLIELMTERHKREDEP